MLYIYILKSKKDGKLYIGKTKDLKKRYKQYNDGEVRDTKGRRPFKLIYYEAFINRIDWTKEELFLKSGIGRESLKHRLKETTNIGEVA